MKITAPTGNGLGVQRFSVNPEGKGLIMGDSSNGVTPPEVTPDQVATPAPNESFEPPKESSPFEKLYPGVDPSSVEMVLDDKTGKLRFKQVEAPPEGVNPPSGQGVNPPVVPTTPDSEVTQLRGELQQMGQLMQAMLIAQAQGKPLGEVLGLTQPASQEPDYSQFDLYDEGQRAEFVRALRAESIAQARAEVQAQIAPHLPSIQGARQQQEYNLAAAKYSKDPDFERKAALTNQLTQGNPNVSWEATYNLVSTIQGALAPSTKAGVTPTPNQAQQTILTPEQQKLKADQAARSHQNSGVRGGGEPQMPENIRSFKEAVRWTAHQAALGNIKG